MTKDELIKQARLKLKDYNIDEKLANYLYDSLFKNDNITLKDEKKYNEMLSRILKGEPIQYVIGRVNFYGFDYKINNKVLIPRFETEELVYYSSIYIKKYFNSNASVVDIGTGSGVIAITLKKLMPDLHIYATDISKDAIIVAKENAKLLDADITILEGNMLEPLYGKKVDVIISNPPYLKKDQTIDKIVLDNEPHISLFGGTDGLKYYHELFENIYKIVNDKFLICLEISEEIKDDLMLLIKKYFKNARYEFKKDMSSRTRMLFIFNNLD